jgi:hypothetical protein
MSRSLFSLLALPSFLDAHFEQLEALEQRLRHNGALVPLQLEFGTHDVRIVAQRDGTYHVHCSEQSGLRHYAAQVAFQPGKPQSARATLVLTDRAGPQTVHLAGDAVFDAQRVPSAFRDAHGHLVERIQRLCAETQARQITSQHTDDATRGGAQNATVQPESVAGAAADTAQTAAAADSFEEVSLERDGQPTLQFRGRMLARVLGPLVGKRRYVLTVYGTPAGNQVAVREGVSLVPFETPRVEAVKLPQEAEERLAALQAFFGFNPTARTLYRALGVEPVETVE